MCKISLFVLLAISVLVTDGFKVELSDNGKLEDNTGYEALIGQFPWYAHIEGWSNGYLVKPCGGTIISSKYVMTAAFCGRSSTSFHLTFGDTNFTMGSSDAIISYIFISHPLFNNPSNLANNIALIELPVNIEFSMSVQAINLPWVDVDETSLHTFFVGTRSIVSPFEMRWHFSQVITNEECSTRVSPLYYQNSTTMCTVGPSFNLNQTPCSLLDGPVLAYFVNSSWIQAGIGSVRGLFCESDSTDIFTRVSQYLPWISAITGITV